MLSMALTERIPLLIAVCSLHPNSLLSIYSDCWVWLVAQVVPFDNHFVSKFSFLSLLGQVAVSADEVETSRF